MFLKNSIDSNTFIDVLLFSGSRPQYGVFGPELWPRSRAERVFQNEADAHLVQAPPTENHEVVLCDKSQSRCQGLEAVVPEDGAAEKGTTGTKHG